MDSARFEDAAPAVSHIRVTTVRLRNLRRDAFLCSAEMASLAGGTMIQETIRRDLGLARDRGQSPIARDARYPFSTPVIGADQSSPHSHEHPWGGLSPDNSCGARHTRFCTAQVPFRDAQPWFTECLVWTKS